MDFRRGTDLSANIIVNWLKVAYNRCRSEVLLPAVTTISKELFTICSMQKQPHGTIIQTHEICLSLIRTDGCAVSEQKKKSMHVLLKHVHSAGKFKISKCGPWYIRDSQCIVQGLSDNVRGVERQTVIKTVQAHDHVDTSFISTTNRKSSYWESAASVIIWIESADVHWWS